jgi:hypothetical protein
MSEISALFREVFGPMPSPNKIRPLDPFLFSLAPVVNGWRETRNPLTGRVFWQNRQGRTRLAPEDA